MNVFPWLLIGGGGAAGSVCRYALQQFLQSRYERPWPLGTAAVNVLGCLLAGLALGWVERNGPGSGPGSGPDAGWRLLLLTGFCGGFTTFSTFALENAALLRGGQVWTAALYAGGSVAGGLLLAALGYWLAR